jgi:beta-xylosidase
MLMRFYFLMLTVFVLFSCKNDEEQPPHAKWTSWTVSDEAIFDGQSKLTSDPSIIRDGNGYKMFYTGFDETRTPPGPEICEATSSDGIHWTEILVPDPVKGRVLYTNSNSWSNTHETSFMLKRDDKYFLYFIGYIAEDTADIFNSWPNGIGLATSIDGQNFAQARDTALLKSFPDSLLDRDAISSPSITTFHDSLVMVYSGYCYLNCGAPVTASLLTARSKDGINWTRRTRAIIKNSEIPWASNGIAESEIILAPDKFYYLFMTSVDEPHVIGLVRSLTTYGPWDVNPEPIVKANKKFSVKGAGSPCVLIEDGKFKLWYHGFSETQVVVGYAEAAMPLKK